MRRGSLLGVFSLGAALMIALTGCGSGESGGSESESGATDGGPPPGGWPQPVDGKLTTKMCGLLTNADYAKYGHQRLPKVSFKQSKAGNSIDCRYTLNDDLTLLLQPTEKTAEITFESGLQDHKERMATDHRKSILATGVVPGADESWFDYWTLGSGQTGEHELRARRGSLIIKIVLSGLKGKNEKDPRQILVGLASLVLKRIPNVGIKDTGVTHKVVFKVTGKGKAEQIIYNEPVGGKTVTLKKKSLPWSTKKPLPALNGGPLTLRLNATSPMARLGCSIFVDGKQVVEQHGVGVTICSYTYTGNGG